MSYHESNDQLMSLFMRVTIDSPTIHSKVNGDLKLKNLMESVISDPKSFPRQSVQQDQLI